MIAWIENTSNIEQIISCETYNNCNCRRLVSCHMSLISNHADAVEQTRMFQEKCAATASDAAERRAAKRHMSVFLLAKVTTMRHHALGRVLNLSETGAKIETSLKFDPGDVLTLEIRSDLKAAGIVRWVREQLVGVEFDRPVDVSRFLSRQQAKLGRVKPRAPRYAVDAQATVNAKTETSIFKVSDVSLSGAGLAGAIALRRDDEILVTIFGLKPRRARVIWANADEVGVTFLKPLDYRDLESWLSATNPVRRA